MIRAQCTCRDGYPGTRTLFSSLGNSRTISCRTPWTPCPRAAQVQLHVQETGSGIAPGQLGQIFEPLYTTKPGGTGLGLYIVQEIMAAHGGQIVIQSAGGQGITFTLTFPYL